MDIASKHSRPITDAVSAATSFDWLVHKFFTTVFSWNAFHYINLDEIKTDVDFSTVIQGGGRCLSSRGEIYICSIYERAGGNFEGNKYIYSIYAPVGRGQPGNAAVSCPILSERHSHCIEGNQRRHFVFTCSKKTSQNTFSHPRLAPVLGSINHFRIMSDISPCTLLAP